MKFDLHNHSNNSDGLLSVKDLIKRAKSKGLDGMALTDHDSVFGVDEAFEYAQKEGMFLLRGLELSTFYKGQTVHILGFFKNNKPPKAIYDLSNEIIETRIARAKKMLNNIENIYKVKIDYDYFFSHGKVLTRGNMFQTIIYSNKELDHALASEMVSDTSPAYIPASKLETVDGLKFLHDNDGIAILAHPTLIKKEFHREILSLGFDGIESRYPKNKDGEEEYFKELAKEFNLLNSAGSDYHGDEKHADIGTSYIDENDFNKILRKLGIEEIKNEN